MMRNIALLGSTGSIGRQALQVIARYSDRFCVHSLSACSRVDLLVEQAMHFKPLQVAIADAALYQDLKAKLSGTGIKVIAGEDSLVELAQDSEADLVFNAVVGFAGLKPTLAALEAGKAMALANKESLVAGGQLVMPSAAAHGVVVAPVDSEHSAIFQCLYGQNRAEVERVVLTASGGPFYGQRRDSLHSVTPEQALKHLNWDMGPKITIDSATLMNKGLEVIEAHWLFDLPYEQINVVIHRESVIHSAVEFVDGAILAQMGTPDMRVPIQYALTFPARLGGDVPRLDWKKLQKLRFDLPDTETFPCLDLAYEAGRTGGSMPAVMNAANEEAVRLFLARKVGFFDIPRIIEGVMNKHKVIMTPGIADLVEVDRLAREMARESAVMKG
jgi:1-deoxy-D-xylulose-5-phosphate reductoisomerase